MDLFLVLILRPVLCQRFLGSWIALPVARLDVAERGSPKVFLISGNHVNCLFLEFRLSDDLKEGVHHFLRGTFETFANTFGEDLSVPCNLGNSLLLRSAGFHVLCLDVGEGGNCIGRRQPIRVNGIQYGGVFFKSLVEEAVKLGTSLVL